MGRKLTGKQKLFVEYYLQSWNATKACRLAGYRGNNNSLGVIGHENLRKLNIKVEIENRLAEVVMGSNEVLARLTDMARGFDITKYIELKETFKIHKKEEKYFREFSGYAIKFDLKKLQKDGYSHLVKKIKPTAVGGIEIEWHDSMNALIQLGKSHKLFIDKHEFEGTIKTSTAEAVDALRKAKKELEKK